MCVLSKTRNNGIVQRRNRMYCQVCVNTELFSVVYMYVGTSYAGNVEWCFSHAEWY